MEGKYFGKIMVGNLIHLQGLIYKADEK